MFSRGKSIKTLYVFDISTPLKGYGCERNNSDTDNVILLPEDKIVQIIEKIVEVKMTKKLDT